MSTDEMETDVSDPVTQLCLAPLTLSENDPQILDLEFHPMRPYLVTSNVEGRVQVYHLSKPQRKVRGVKPQEHKIVATLDYHTESCRTLAFHPSGSHLYTGSLDKSIGIVDATTWKLSSQRMNAHESGINRIAFYNENLFVSGDDDGFVNIWDLRTSQQTASVNSKVNKGATNKPNLKHILHYQDAGDYISDILPMPEKNRLLLTSGDGHLYVYDLRAGHIHEMLSGKGAVKNAKLQSKGSKKSISGGRHILGGVIDTWFAMSDDVDDELSGIVSLKNGKKLAVAGREEGVLNIFKYDYFGHAEDHFTLSAGSTSGSDMDGSGASIDCMIKIDEDTVITGSTDGLIRLVQVHPNKLLSILGTHEDFPIECVKISPARPDYFDSAVEPEEQQDQDEEGEDDDDDDDNAPTSKSHSSHIAAQPSTSFTSFTLPPRFLASSSHDQTVKLWNVSELFEVDPNEVREKDDSSDEQDDGEDEENDDGDEEMNSSENDDGDEEMNSSENDDGDEEMNSSDDESKPTPTKGKKAASAPQVATKGKIPAAAAKLVPASSAATQTASSATKSSLKRKREVPPTKESKATAASHDDDASVDSSSSGEYDEDNMSDVSDSSQLAGPPPPKADTDDEDGRDDDGDAPEDDDESDQGDQGAETRDLGSDDEDDGGDSGNDSDDIVINTNLPDLDTDDEDTNDTDETGTKMQLKRKVLAKSSSSHTHPDGHDDHVHNDKCGHSHGSTDGTKRRAPKVSSAWDKFVGESDTKKDAAAVATAPTPSFLSSANPFAFPSAGGSGSANPFDFSKTIGTSLPAAAASTSTPASSAPPSQRSATTSANNRWLKLAPSPSPLPTVATVDDGTDTPVAAPTTRVKKSAALKLAPASSSFTTTAASASSKKPLPGSKLAPSTSTTTPNKVSSAFAKLAPSSTHDDSDSDDAGPARKKSKTDLNSETKFFSHLPANHPMHPSQAQKRANKAELKIEEDNIAKRGEKKRAQLQELLAKKKAKRDRFEERKSAAIERGEDPDMISESEEEEAVKGKGKGGMKVKRMINSDDDDDGDEDSDDSDAPKSSKSQPRKERKLSAKEKKAQAKAEKRKNPFFSGL